MLISLGTNAPQVRVRIRSSLVIGTQAHFMELEAVEAVTLIIYGCDVRLGTVIQLIKTSFE